MSNVMTALELRRWAEHCLASNRLAGDEERSRFSKMVAALHVLAGQQDWLDGKLKPLAA